MQQRRLRLGDILDDYCPRERRITNHAVVAMIEDDVRQTRCTTCDTEHEFKQAKMPTLRKKKEAVSAAYKEVLAGVVKDTSGTAAPSAAPAAPQGEAVPSEVPVPSPPAAAQDPAPVAAAAADPRPEAEQIEGMGENGNDEAEGPESPEAEAARVHRRLIRATLPRPENHQVVRPAGARAQRPGVGRGNNLNAGARGGGFSRPATGRGPQGGRATGRPDAHRARGGQPPRHGKKHSK